MRQTSLAILLVAGCAADLSDSQPIAVRGDEPIAAGLPGAIFTTLRDGSAVAANTYSDKADVYLDGGPKDPQDAALPEGDYVFQVTDPSGETLLSTDAASCRMFHIDVGGRITATMGGACAHAWGNDLVRHGNLTVQLMPYLDTPNNGGEYRVWVTSVAAYQAFNAFVPRLSKTDNFKVVVENGSGSDSGSGGGSGSGSGSSTCGG